MTPKGFLKKHVIICVGPGGVGKTTVAAAIGVAVARQRRRTAVITVDPARRLKDALGLRHLSSEPHSLALGDDVWLDALALDAKHTFDALVERFAASPAAVERIMQNRLYQELSTGLAGSAEYMAMEKLYQLITVHKYQTVVVDTPPSAHARELLSAPHRLADLLASRAVSLLKSPASLLAGTSSLARLTLGPLLRGLERWTGLHLLSDLAEFTSAFEDLTAGFSERAEQVATLLRAPSTAFVLVTTPDPHTVDITIEFHRALRAAGYRVAGIIANRVLAFPALGHANGTHAPAHLRDRLLANYQDLRRLSIRDEHSLQRLHEATHTPVLAAVPQLADLPVSVPHLGQFARYFESTQ
jgi:anion-transporting  ArsA/GET3 family ATPase